MTRHCIGLGLPVVVLLAMAPPALAGALTASPNILDPGTTTTLTLSAPLSSADGIAGVDLEITFDPTLLSYVDASFALGVPLADWTPVINAGTPGDLFISLANYAGSPDPDTAGASEALFTLNFLASTGTGAQTSISLDLPSSDVGVPGEFQIDPQSVSVTVNAPVTHAVPEPTPLLVLLSTIPFMIALAARRAR